MAEGKDEGGCAFVGSLGGLVDLEQAQEFEWGLLQREERDQAALQNVEEGCPLMAGLTELVSYEGCHKKRTRI